MDGRATASTLLPRPVALVVVVALAVVAGVLLLRPVDDGSTAATVTSVTPAQVCLAVDDGPADLCLDAVHVEHLGLGGLRRGQCLDLAHQGGVVVAESLTGVTLRSC